MVRPSLSSFQLKRARTHICNGRQDEHTHMIDFKSKKPHQMKSAPRHTASSTTPNSSNFCRSVASSVCHARPLQAHSQRGTELQNDYPLSRERRERGYVCLCVSEPEEGSYPMKSFDILDALETPLVPQKLSSLGLLPRQILVTSGAGAENFALRASCPRG
jgi:hypothetical protein